MTLFSSNNIPGSTERAEVETLHVDTVRTHKRSPEGAVMSSQSCAEDLSNEETLIVSTVTTTTTTITTTTVIIIIIIIIFL